MPPGYPRAASTENLDVNLMRVMFLQPQPSIWALKLARGLKAMPGEKVSLLKQLGKFEEPRVFGVGEMAPRKPNYLSACKA